MQELLANFRFNFFNFQLNIGINSFGCVSSNGIFVPTMERIIDLYWTEKFCVNAIEGK